MEGGSSLLSLLLIRLVLRDIFMFEPLFISCTS